MMELCYRNDLAIGTYLTVLPPPSAVYRRLRSGVPESVRLSDDGFLELRMRIPGRRIGRFTQLIGGGHSVENWGVVGTGTQCCKRSQQSHWRVLSWYDDENMELETDASNGVVTALCKRHANRITGLEGFQSNEMFYAPSAWRANVKKLQKQYPDFPAERMRAFIDTAEAYMQQNRWYGEWYRCIAALEDAASENTKQYGKLPVGLVWAIVRKDMENIPIPDFLVLLNGDVSGVKTHIKAAKPLQIINKRSLETNTADLSLVHEVDPTVTCESLLKWLCEDSYTQKGVPVANKDVLYVLGKITVKPKTKESIIKQINERAWVKVLEVNV